MKPLRYARTQLFHHQAQKLAEGMSPQPSNKNPSLTFPATRRMPSGKWDSQDHHSTLVQEMKL
jgi:hypothetical protein